MTSNRNMNFFADNTVKIPKIISLNLSSMQNINKNLSGLRTISRNDKESDGIEESVFYIQPPVYRQFKTLESNSSVPFWNKRLHNQYYVDPDDGFIGRSSHDSCRANCESHELPIRSSSCTIDSQHLENGQLRNQFSPAHRSVSGLSGNQSEGNRNESNTSSNRQKRKLTRQYFVTTFSICYAIFLVVFGAIVFIGDVVHDLYPVPQAFCIYMLSMAFVFFLYLYIDIRLYGYRNKKLHKDRLDRKQLVDNYIINNMLQTDHGTNLEEIRVKDAYYKHALRELNLKPLKTIPHRYCFRGESIGDSLYLKLGASWFAFGLLVYSALQISYDVNFIASNGQILYECASYVTLALNILFPIYSLFSLFFIVKYMNVIINVNQSVARIFLLHAIGTSLTLWVFSIIRETVDAIAESDAETAATVALRNAHPNDSLEFVYNDCGKSIALNAVHRQFAPYLYPFVIEYCILMVGIYCNIYANINQCPRKKLTANGNDIEPSTFRNANPTEYPASVKLSERFERTDDHDIGIKSSFHIHVDCQSSFRGIFVGLMLATMTIVFVILMFVGFENRSYLETSIVVNHIFECSVLAILVISTVCAYAQTIKLDIIQAPSFGMDEILLLIPQPAFFIEFIFSIVPAIKMGNPLLICIPIFRQIQVLIQTPFLIDGIKRCSNSTYLQEKKIGRGFIIFLAIANMALWIYNTFSSKTILTSDFRYTYYGYVLWNILNHISLPLIMFYRFHSSVLLVDIWNHAYKNARKHQ